MRAWKLIPLLGLTCLTTAWSGPAPSVNAVAQAQGDTTRPVVILATVDNRNAEPLEGATVVVQCIPKVGKSGQGGGNTLRDPLELREKVPPVPAGKSQVVTVRTPYESRNSFRGQRSTFRANNIDPTNEYVVEFRVRLETARP